MLPPRSRGARVAHAFAMGVGAVGVIIAIFALLPTWASLAALGWLFFAALALSVCAAAGRADEDRERLLADELRLLRSGDTPQPCSHLRPDATRWSWGAGKRIRIKSEGVL